jgi:hypothetical protein
MVVITCYLISYIVYWLSKTYWGAFRRVRIRVCTSVEKSTNSSEVTPFAGPVWLPPPDYNVADHKNNTEQSHWLRWTDRGMQVSCQTAMGVGTKRSSIFSGGTVGSITPTCCSARPTLGKAKPLGVSTVMARYLVLS